MCGTAEVGLGLARLGFQVVGVDLSPTMLAVGTGRLVTAPDFPARSLSLTLAEASRLPSCAAAFDFVLVGGSGSFNHLDGVRALAALREIGRALRPGGALGAELVNPRLLEDIPPSRTFAPLRPPPVEGHLERVCSSRYEPAEGRYYVQQTTRLSANDVEVHQSQEVFALRVWEPQQIRDMLEATGFRNVRVLGGLDLAPYGRWSSDLLVLAENGVAAAT
jgi:SAM-dependent methyltransferase